MARKTPNLRSCAIVVALLFGGCFVVMRLIATGATAGANNHRSPDQTEMHAPVEMFRGPMQVATLSQKTFAVKIMNAQLASFRSGKFDPVSMSQGRFAGFLVPNDRSYYNYLNKMIKDVGQYHLIKSAPIKAFTGHSDICILAPLQGPVQTAIVVFYANRNGSHGGPDIPPRYF